MGERKGANRVLVGNLEGNDNLEDPGVDRRMILEGHGGMEWIDLAQKRNRWQALVNAVMSPRVPQNAGNFLPS